MSTKNLLASTDYTKGTDNRFKNAVLIGKVSEVVVDSKGANIRAIMPDKVDHQGQPLITKPIPVLQTSAGKKRSFAMPRIGQNVLLVKLPNGTADYAAIGFFYTSKDPPPVTDPKLDYIEYDDGSTMQFDAESGTLTWKLKGDVNWDNEGAALLKFQGDFTVEPTGNILLKPTGTVTLEASTIFLKGNINHTGNMTTTGVHTDSLGHHTSSERQEDLLRRIEALEQRVAALETAQGGKLS